MAVQLRFSQGGTTGTWGQAARVAVGAEVTIAGQATGATTIGSWQIWCHYAHYDASLAPTPSTPVLLDQGADATPSATLTPAHPGAYLFELRTFAATDYTGTATRDVRELRAVHEHLNDCAPAVPSAAAQTLISAQVTAGAGRHDNFTGFAWGFGGPAGGPGLAALYEQVEQLLIDVAEAAEAAETAQGVAEAAAEAAATALGTAEGAAGMASSALEAAGDAQDQIDIIESTRLFEAGTFSATLTVTRSTYVVYSGADESVELQAGAGPHTPGAMLDLLFPAGTITGEHVVALADNLHPVGAELFDPNYNFRVLVVVTRTSQLLASCRVEPTADVVAPQISAASVADADLNAVAVTTSESVTWAATTGFSIAGHTITGVAGAGTSWSLALGEDVDPGESLTLVWDGTNVVADLAENPLAAGSRAITNNAAYPTIQSASISANQLTLTFSKAVTVTGVTGLTLDGTTATVTSVVSGSGTTSVVFGLSGSVTGGTVTLDVAVMNDVTAVNNGLALQAIEGIPVDTGAAEFSDVYEASLAFDYAFADAEVTRDENSRVSSVTEHSAGESSAELTQTTPGNRLYYTAQDADGNGRPSVNTGAYGLNHSLTLLNPASGGVSLVAPYELIVIVKPREGYKDGAGYVLTARNGTPYSHRCLGAVGTYGTMRADIGDGSPLDVLMVAGLACYRLTVGTPVGGVSACRLYRRGADGSLAQSSEVSMSTGAVAGLALLTGFPGSVFRVVGLSAASTPEQWSSVDTDILQGVFGFSPLV